MYKCIWFSHFIKYLRWDCENSYLLYSRCLVPETFCCRKTFQLNVSGRNSTWRSTEPRDCPKWTPASWLTSRKRSLEKTRIWWIRTSRFSSQGRRWAQLWQNSPAYVLQNKLKLPFVHNAGQDVHSEEQLWAHLERADRLHRAVSTSVS